MYNKSKVEYNYDLFMFSSSSIYSIEVMKWVASENNFEGNAFWRHKALQSAENFSESRNLALVAKVNF